ncbi:MAG: transglutaminase domain-containing protein [Chloroflexota bacterium]
MSVSSSTSPNTINQRSFGSVFSRIGGDYPLGYDYGLNVHFEDGKLLTGILVSLLYLVVAVSFDAAGYVTSMGLLFPVTLGALLLGFLMSFSRFDGFFAVSHSMFVCLAFILFMMTRLVTEEEIEPILNNDIPDLQARAYLILIEWVNWLQDAFAGTPNNNNYVFIFEISFLMWWLTYLGIWAIYRFGYTWLAIMPAGIAMTLNTYYAHNSVIGFLVVFAMLGLVLLVRTNLAEHQLRWRGRRIHFNPDISLDFLRNGLAFSVAVIAISWITPNLGRNVQLREVLTPVNTWWEETTNSVSKLYEGVTPRTRSAAAAFGPQLKLGGERNFGNSVIFQVDAGEGRYWRAVTYDTYTGTEWFNTSETTLDIEAATTIPVGDWQMRTPLTQTITLLSPTGNVVFGAPDIFKASIPLIANYNFVDSAPVPSSAVLDEVTDEQAIELTMTRTNRGLEPGDSYTVVSWQVDITQNALRAAGTNYPSDAFVERYTQLPEDFSERVKATALEQTTGAVTAYDKAAMLEGYLRGFEYDDQIPAPSAGTDPVEYFLYDIQRGYCDYYATSMVTMLRSLGIPSRTASGYAEGSYETLSGTDEDLLMGEGIHYISERDAHTWVEVYFPDFGWVEFEPTAGESDLIRPEDRDDDLAALRELASRNNGNFPNPGFEIPEIDDPFPEAPSGFPLPGTGGLGGGNIPQVPLLTSLALIVAAVGGGWFFLRRSNLIGPTAFTPELAPILFERMHNWAERLGIHFKSSDTPYEQAHQLVRVLPQGRKPIENITDSYVYYQFGRDGEVAMEGTGSGFGQPGGLLPKGDMRILNKQLDLPESWNSLKSLFLKAWLNKLMSRFNWRKQDHYALKD